MNQQVSGFAQCKELFKSVVSDTLKAELRDMEFHRSTVQELTEKVSITCLKALQALQKPFKLFVSSNIIENANTAFHSSTSVLGGAADGSFVVKWHSPNGSLACYTFVHGVALKS